MEAFKVTSQHSADSMPPRLLGDLLEQTLPTDLAGLQVCGLASDSRAVGQGDLFFALNGLSLDGRNFIDDAIKRGAAAVFAEADDGFALSQNNGVPVIAIPNLNRQVSAIAGRFYGQPSEQLNVVGITGTNGKTSCSHMVASLANNIGRNSGVVGTLGYGVFQQDGLQLEATGLTTPDAVKLQACMRLLLDKGCEVVATEVSSHALAQYRADAIHFKVAVLTNLSRDHLDFHNDMASYADAKRRLFYLDDVDAAVINIDDPFGASLAAELQGKLSVLTYSTQTRADIYVSEVRYEDSAINAVIETHAGSGEARLPLIGEFNLSNALAALAAMLSSGEQLEPLLAAFDQISPVPGRMEIITSTQGQRADKTVVVDYAHTPHALEVALQALQAHADKQLWCVFGCGGDRDHGKRAEMGRIAKALADQVVVTSDNPRSEPAEQIIDDILLGIDAMQNVHVEPDRKAAITFAIQQAAPGDMILVAGKGHEAVQIVGDLLLPFSDAEVIREYLFDGGQR